MDHEKRKEDLLKEIIDADDTGMVAEEAFIAQADTWPVVPHAKLHASLPRGHVAHSTIDKLHAEMQASSPDRRAIEKHVSDLGALPELEATIANWWEDPTTQRFIANLSQIGL
jgi:hypothetical protein